ncbi:MAG: amidohydrolase [Myxococcales bacterium]|nr:amidohydrolase [Myxococcales bacterium]
MPGEPHTVVFTARRIHTLNPGQPTAQALVMKGGTIIYVGSREDALDVAGGGASVEDFPDSIIVPGLVDAHAHLASLGRSLALASLSAAKSEADAIARVKRAGESTLQGEWVVGRGWDQNDWAGQQWPSRATLDSAFAGQPVYLTRVDGHAAWVSSKALALAGITRSTQDPPGGRILRDEKGEPTGILIDNAMDLVAAKVPAPTKQAQQKRLKLALETCARLGLTAVHDAGMDLETFRQLQQWDMGGVLPVRVYAMADGQGPQADEFLGLGLFKGQRLEMRAVKLLLDGALGSRGAALHQPYSDEPAQSGLLLLEPDALAAKAKAFSERGFQVAVHAIGDRANTLTIDALEALEKAKPGGRHRVEHAQVLTADDVARLGKDGLIASFQPTHATSDMPWAEARLGPERVKLAYAWKAVMSAGGKVAFGSDFPVEDPNPLWGLYAARTRQDHASQPSGGWLPEQKLSGEEALAGFTTGAAYASFSEGRRGMLKTGFDADFVVLPLDPIADPPDQLLNAKVQVTVVDGVDVYRAQP